MLESCTKERISILSRLDQHSELYATEVPLWLLSLILTRYKSDTSMGSQTQSKRASAPQYSFHGTDRKGWMVCSRHSLFLLLNFARQRILLVLLLIIRFQSLGSLLQREEPLDLRSIEATQINLFRSCILRLITEVHRLVQGPTLPRRHSAPLFPRERAQEKIGRTPKTSCSFTTSKRHSVVHHVLASCISFYVSLNNHIGKRLVRL